MKLIPVHHVPMRPEFNSPFSAGYLVEGGRLLFFSGCGPVPSYHKHPHDPVEEAQWFAGDFRDQCEKTFANMRLILQAAGADWPNMLKLNIYLTDMTQQNILNEISTRTFDPKNPPARTLVAVPELAHPSMLLEIEGVAAVPAPRKAAARKRPVAKRTAGRRAGKPARRRARR